jgi:hypothetical protein
MEQRSCLWGYEGTKRKIRKGLGRCEVLLGGLVEVAVQLRRWT